MGYLPVQVILLKQLRIDCGMIADYTSCWGQGNVIRTRRIESDRAEDFVGYIPASLLLHIYPLTLSCLMRAANFSHDKKRSRKVSMHMYIGSLMHSVDV